MMRSMIVSILVLVDQSLGVLCGIMTLSDVVSILVLVDQSLGVNASQQRLQSILSFNPCFSGSVSRSICPIKCEF